MFAEYTAASQAPAGTTDVTEKILIIKNPGNQLSNWRWCQEDLKGPGEGGRKKEAEMRALARARRGTQDDFSKSPPLAPTQLSLGIHG